MYIKLLQPPSNLPTLIAKQLNGAELPASRIVPGGFQVNTIAIVQYLMQLSPRAAHRFDELNTKISESGGDASGWFFPAEECKTFTVH